MSSLAVRNAVKARLAANWATTPIHDVTNTNVIPDNQQAWIAVQFTGAFEEQASIGDPGNNIFREAGTFFVHIVVPQGTGTDTLLTYAETLRSLFRGVTFSGVRCISADPPNTETGSTVIAEDGAVFGASFAVDYQYDINA